MKLWLWKHQLRLESNQINQSQGRTAEYLRSWSGKCTLSLIEEVKSLALPLGRWCVFLHFVGWGALPFFIPHNANSPTLCRMGGALPLPLSPNENLPTKAIPFGFMTTEFPVCMVQLRNPTVHVPKEALSPCPGQGITFWCCRIDPFQSWDNLL